MKIVSIVYQVSETALTCYYYNIHSSDEHNFESGRHPAANPRAIFFIPPFTPLAAWSITKARPLKKDGLAAFIAILGIALISLNGELGIQMGDPVTLLSY
ncbi:hypothetical protein [[Clostridium] scindens]|uniref:hypothetical protein n=1 Tax=Clostridium scindens (strain JCM 10418 / VPI 12708) TaxID=29347 RepID=UPI003AB95777